jgi:hypothetical protein
MLLRSIHYKTSEVILVKGEFGSRILTDINPRLTKEP